MVVLATYDRVLWFTSTALAAVIVIRILREHLLVGPFKAFASMLVVIVLRDITLAIPPYRSHTYPLLWALTLAPLLAAQVWAGWATLRAVARLYPKIGNFAVRLFVACLITTILICCLGLPFELHRMTGQERLLRELFLLHRSIDSWIAGTLILVAAFFLRFPAPLKQPPRNLVVHTILLSLYFSGYAVLFFAENLAPLGAAAIVERLQFSLVVLLYGVWAIAFSAKGQESEPWPTIEVIVLEKLGEAKQAVAQAAGRK